MNKQIIVGPLVTLLKSRKFIVAVAGLLAYVLVQGLPALAGQHDTVAGVIVILAGLVMGGITLEDAAKSIAQGPQTWQDDIRAIVLEIVNAVLDEYQTRQVSATTTPPNPAASGSSNHV